MKLMDGTIVIEPGQTGNNWRFYYCVSLPNLRCEYTKLMPVKGAGTGEKVEVFPVKENDFFHR